MGVVVEGGTSGIAWQRSAHLRVERRLSPSVAGAKEDEGRPAWRLSSSPLKKKKKSVDVLVVSSHRCLRQTPAFSFGRKVFTGWPLLHEAVLKN